MMDCWAKKPNDRPPFSNIVKTVSNYTEAIAGYTDVNFNPFVTTHHPTSEVEAPFSGSPDNDRDAEVLVRSPKQASPSQDSPLLKSRKVSEGQLSTASGAGIEIRIESPSEEGSVANSSIQT